MMDEKTMQEVLDELFSAIEALETQNGAILQFLKNRGIASGEDFAPFLEEAAKTSNVRWRATRIRVNHLLSNVSKANKSSKEIPAAATDKNTDQHAAQQRSHGNSEQSRRTAERAEQDSRAETDNGAPQQNSDSNQKAEGNDVDKPAHKDAA